MKYDMKYSELKPFFHEVEHDEGKRFSNFSIPQRPFNDRSPSNLSTDERTLIKLEVDEIRSRFKASQVNHSELT